MTQLKPDSQPESRPRAVSPSRRGLTRLVAVVVAAGAIFWLGYGIGRVQNIAQVASLTRDADVDRYTLSRGGTVVDFERLGGGGKPFLRSADGFELLDVSDWDHNSRIVVDGNSYELARLYPTSFVDYGAYRVAETLHGSRWLLEREIALDAHGAVHLTHTFVARAPIHDVELSVAYVHAFFTGLSITPGQVSASISRQDREFAPGGDAAPPAYRLRIVADPSGPQPAYRVGDTSALGPTSVVADMTARDPRPQERTLLASETVQIHALS